LKLFFSAKRNALVIKRHKQRIPAAIG